MKAEDPGVVSLQLSGSRLQLAASSYGRTRVTISALDIRDEKAEVSFLVACPNPEKPVSAWPQPADDELFISIDTQDLTPVDLVFFSATGSRVYSERLEGSAFEPIRVNLEKMAPGRYTAVATYNGVEHKLSFVKR